MDPFAHLLTPSQSPARRCRGRIVPDRRRMLVIDPRRRRRATCPERPSRPKHRNPSPRSSSAAPVRWRGHASSDGWGRAGSAVRSGRRSPRANSRHPRRQHRRCRLAAYAGARHAPQDQNHRPRHRDAAAPARLQGISLPAAAPTFRDGPQDCEPDITTPPPPVCRGSACPPPGGPGVIVTPPPSGGGGFGAGYLAALPRIAEGARANPGPALYAKQVLVLIDQAQPAALEDILAQQYNLQRLNNQTLTLIAARAQLYAIPDGRTVAALVVGSRRRSPRTPRPRQLRLPPAGRNQQDAAGGGAAIRPVQNVGRARA